MAHYVKNDINYHGARSKTTASNPSRQRNDSGTKKNKSYSADSKSNNTWDPSQYAAPRYQYGIWDNLPETPTSNTWEENKEVSGWSTRNRRFHRDSDNSSIQISGERPKDLNSEFPPLEKKPVGNVWEAREKKYLAKKALEPTNESEEERMIRQALELSRLEAKKDEERRRQLQEEYDMQMQLLSLNPLEFEEFRTDEEIAMALSSVKTADVPFKEDLDYDNCSLENSKKESQKQDAFHHKENTRNSDQGNSQNRKQKDHSLPKSSTQALPSSERTFSASSNKKNISQVVDMFGGWGPVENSKKPGGKSKEVADTTPKLLDKKDEKNEGDVSTTSKTTKLKVSSNSAEKRNSKQDKKKEIVKDVSESQQKSMVNNSEADNYFDCSEDFGWQSETDKPAFRTKNKDDDEAWKTNDKSSSIAEKIEGTKDKNDRDLTSKGTISSIQQENCIGKKTEDKNYSVAEKYSSIPSENPMVIKAKEKRGAKDDDWASMSKDSIPVSFKHESPIAIKTEEKHHLSAQKYSNKPKSTSSNENGTLAENIVSDYVNLAAKCKSPHPKDDHSKNDPSTAKDAFDVLQQDFAAGANSQKAQKATFNSTMHKTDDSQTADNSNKSQFTNLVDNKNEISYSFENNASEKNLSSDNSWNKYCFESSGKSPFLHSLNPDEMEDNDISLPLFSKDNLPANGHTVINSPKPSEPITFPESLEAHFQQFQAPNPNPSPPVFAPPTFMNPSLMMGMNPLMMQQMMAMPFFMQQMQAMQAYCMPRPMGFGLPFIPQSVPSFQPFMNPAQSSENPFINPPIPPPSERCDSAVNNEMNASQVDVNRILQEASPEINKWFEDSPLQEPQFNGQHIPPPTGGYFNGDAFDSPPKMIPAPKSLAHAAPERSVPTKVDDSRWIDDDGASSNVSTLNDDRESISDCSKSMRNSARYATDRKKEIRQPSSQPCFARVYR